METPDDRWDKVMAGIKPEKRFTVPGITIYQNGEIKLFGLFTVNKKKEKKGEKSITDSDDFTGI